MALFHNCMKKKYISWLILVSVFFANILSVFAQNGEVLGAKISSNGDSWIANKRIEYIGKMLSSAYFPFSYADLNILLDSLQKEPRGQIRGKNITVSNQVVDDAEFLKLIAHEVAHFVDIYILRATENSSDPSLDFYKISWKTPKIKSANARISSFVSGYSATNQYEDFAETFVWYVFHNKTFLDQAMRNTDLREKYLFFADNVFKK